MQWLAALAIFLLPFVFLIYQRHLAGRLLLFLFWALCGTFGAWFLSRVPRIEADLNAVQAYALPHTPGSHAITIARPSQRSMKGVLRGGAGLPPPEDLGKLGWCFAEPGVWVTWLAPRTHDGPDAGDSVLFYVEYGSPEGPLTLQYRINEAQAALLSGRTLVVGHDSGARKMLRTARSVYNLFGWGLVGWGGLWMIVQAALWVGRWRARRCVL